MLVGWRGFEVSGNGAFSGMVQFFYHRVTEASRNFVGRARIRAWWEWRIVGDGTVLFTTEYTEGTEKFW